MNKHHSDPRLEQLRQVVLRSCCTNPASVKLKEVDAKAVVFVVRFGDGGTAQVCFFGWTLISSDEDVEVIARTVNEEDPISPGDDLDFFVGGILDDWNVL